MNVDSKILASINYFSDCSPQELSEIIKYFFYKTIRKGETLFTEGNTCEFLYFIVSGVVKVYKISIDGRQQIVNIARFGETINDVSIFGGKPNIANIVAMTPVTLYGIHKDDLINILFNYPKVVLKALEELATKARRNATLIQSLSFDQATSRVANILLNNIYDQIEPGFKLTQQDMADIAGISREMVNKVLKEMVEQDIIITDRSGVTILNRERLEQIAGSSL